MLICLYTRQRVHSFRAINPTPRLSALCLARTTGVRVDALRDSPPQHSADADEGSSKAARTHGQCMEKCSGSGPNGAMTVHGDLFDSSSNSPSAELFSHEQVHHGKVCLMFYLTL